MIELLVVPLLFRGPVTQHRDHVITKDSQCGGGERSRGQRACVNILNETPRHATCGLSMTIPERSGNGGY